jgi:hypothetical protein
MKVAAIFVLGFALHFFWTGRKQLTTNYNIKFMYQPASM